MKLLFAQTCGSVPLSKLEISGRGEDVKKGGRCSLIRDKRDKASCMQKHNYKK